MSVWHVLVSGLYILPVVLWAIIGKNAWRLLPRGRLRAMIIAVAGLFMVHMSLHAVFWLIPAEPYQDQLDGLGALYVLNDLTLLAVLALGRDMVRSLPALATPGATWLAVNYGATLVLALVTLSFPALVPGATLESQRFVYLTVVQLYVIVMVALMLREVASRAVRGTWRAGGGVGMARRADVAILAACFVGVIGFLLLIVAGGPMVHPSRWGLALDLVIGVGFAVPFAVRILGEVVRGLLLVAGMTLATGAVYLGVRTLGTTLGPGWRPLLDLGTVLGLVAVLVPVQSWLRLAIDRVVFRRPRRRRAELQERLYVLSPEKGAVECCRQALADLAAVMELHGAAVLLGDGQTVVHGDCALGPLPSVWPRGAAADALPRRVLLSFELRELPLPVQEALAETAVVGTVPVASPRRYWGHLFFSTGLLGAAFLDEDVQALEGFAAQLALVLDGAELLARAVAVERSLAHSEKLAAIGELAARIAHEIRNPVTAARSLAQQLCREPASPFASEHAVILAELERVERQVAALLRFARREEFRFEAVDVAELVRATVASFRSRFEAAQVAVAVEAAGASVTRADREKLRQVVVNLIENALDALVGSRAGRSLSVAVGNGQGAVTVTVSDNGPGVPADAVPHLFEPFFSLKPTGTGLGLAIARRTVEAHGGRIVAATEAGGGMRFEITLPGAEGAAT